jgi:hypothetical protein
MKIPRYLADHPAIEDIEDMAEQSTYRWGVWLKEGWVFEYGRNRGGRSFNFMNKKEFDCAHPVRVEELRNT